MQRRTIRRAGLGLPALAAIVALLSLSACSSNDVAEKAAESAGIDNLDLGGSGTATIGDETIDFEVSACLEQNGNVTLASNQDPVVAIDSATGALTISNGDNNYVASNAEVTVEGGKLTATATADVTTINGQPGTEPVDIEVTADCK